MFASRARWREEGAEMSLAEQVGPRWAGNWPDGLENSIHHKAPAAAETPEERYTSKEPQRTLQSPSDVRQWLVRIRRRSRLHGKVLSITGERSRRHHPTHEAPGYRKGRPTLAPRRPRQGHAPPLCPSWRADERRRRTRPNGSKNIICHLPTR